MKALSRNVLFAVALATAPLALAHTHPTQMSPAADVTVSAPDAVVIHFSEPLEPKFSSISVTDAGGHVVNKEASTCAPDAKSMSVKLPVLKPGSYTVNWVGVSTDTHRTQGDYKFTVK